MLDNRTQRFVVADSDFRNGTASSWTNCETPFSLYSSARMQHQVVLEAPVGVTVLVRFGVFFHVICQLLAYPSIEVLSLCSPCRVAYVCHGLSSSLFCFAAGFWGICWDVVCT